MQRVCVHGYRKESRTFRYSQGRAPLIPQNVQTDASVGIDVGVIDACCEVDLWWLKGVVCWEVNG